MSNYFSSFEHPWRILRDAREFSARINGPEVFAAADGLSHELRPAR